MGLRPFTVGQPDLEAGVTASTGLFFYALIFDGNHFADGADAGDADAGAAAVAFTSAGSMKLTRS